MPKAQVFKRFDLTTPKGGIMLNGHIVERDAKKGDGSKQDTYRNDDHNLKIAWPVDTDFSALKKAVLEVAKENFGFTKLSQFQHPFRKGNDNVDKETGEVRQGFADTVYVNAKSKFEIELFNKKRQVMTPEAAKELFYNGCKVIAVVTAGPYEGSEKVRNADGSSSVETYQGVGLYLSAVQFVGDGERIGGGGSKASLLEAIEDDGDDDDFGESLSSLDEGTGDELDDDLDDELI